MYRARAALPVIAPFLRARQIEVLAQRVQQRRARIECESLQRRVDAQLDVDRSDMRH
jgi:hypothetical protein